MLGAAGSRRQARISRRKVDQELHQSPETAAASVTDISHRSSPEFLSERERVVALINLSREKLIPVAAFDESKVSFWGVMCDKKKAQLFQDLGKLDGVGVFTTMAGFKLTNGTISDAELARFKSEGALLIDTLATVALNYLVVCSLLLTIYVSLIVSGGSVFDVRTGVDGIAAGLGAWADLPAFAWPGDEDAQAALRRALYAIEYGLLGLGMASSTIGMFVAVFFYIMVSTGLPSTIAKLEDLSENPAKLSALQDYSLNGGIDVLTFALPFVAARSSAIAFFCCCGAAFLVHGVWAPSNGLRSGMLSKSIRAQVREAKRALAMNAEAGSTASACTMGAVGGGTKAGADAAARVAWAAHSPAAHSPAAGAEEAMIALVQRALPSLAEPASLAAGLQQEGFTHATLQEAALRGLDVYAALRDVERPLGLRPGDRLALAAAASSELST